MRILFGMAIFHIHPKILIFLITPFKIHPVKIIIFFPVWSGRDRECVDGICHAVRFISAMTVYTAYVLFIN